MSNFKRVLSIAIVFLAWTAASTAQAESYDQKMRTITNDPGYRIRQLVQNVDIAIARASDKKTAEKTAETCALLGALSPQFDAIKSSIAPLPGGPLDKAAIKSFGITGYCGVKFIGDDLIKEGDTKSLVKRLHEIGDLVVASARVARPLED